MMHLLTPEEAELAVAAQKKLLVWFSFVPWLEKSQGKIEGTKDGT